MDKTSVFETYNTSSNLVERFVFKNRNENFSTNVMNIEGKINIDCSLMVEHSVLVGVM